MLSEIEVDLALLDKLNFNGEELSYVRIESQVHETLAIKAVGDCTRIVMLVKSLLQGKGIPKVKNINQGKLDYSSNNNERDNQCKCIAISRNECLSGS